MAEVYELRCRECGRRWGNQARSFCEECLSPLEVTYDYEAIAKNVSRAAIEAGPHSIWRYRALLPIVEDESATLPVGYTPLVPAKSLGKRWGAQKLYVKNDAICFPTLSFKDRVVCVALSAARQFGFKVVSCSSTGNLANAVAAQAARRGFDAWIFVPSDIEQAKILGTQIYGAWLVPITGNYDQVNRLCTQIAERYPWGFVNVNLRPYYAEGSKTVGFEIAEQLGWRLPDNVVVPMAGGALITKIRKAFDEFIRLGLVEDKPVRFFGAQATGCSPITTAVKDKQERFTPQKPSTVARSIAIGNPADGFYALRTIRDSGGWAEDVPDNELIEGIELLAETEGIFTETAGGVTTSVTQKLLAQGRIRADETTVMCITGNGLKTTDVLIGRMKTFDAIPPRLEAFEEYSDRVQHLARAAGAAL